LQGHDSITIATSTGDCGMSAREPLLARDGYGHFEIVPTRWLDNDAYAHVNNTVYYGWFDTVVNSYLVAAGVLDIAAGTTIGLVVETGCRYARPVSFPQPVEIGLRVAQLGRSSVRYELGVFTDGVVDAAAQGFFVHVYVDRVTRRPVPLGDDWRAALERLLK
jgi:acyl-CoA thioester hydrolase